MYSPGNPYFNLSDEGKKEFGHIFGEGVPIKGHITEAELEGSENATDFVVRVDWEKLTDTQQTQCLVYMSEKFGKSQEVIRADIEQRGCFPLRSRFILEAYDLRFFI